MAIIYPQDSQTFHDSMEADWDAIAEQNLKEAIEISRAAKLDGVPLSGLVFPIVQILNIRALDKLQGNQS